MSQRTKELTQILGYYGWKVAEVYFEAADGSRVKPIAGFDVPQDVRVVLVAERRWAPRCHDCGAIGSKTAKHEQLKTRRWLDLQWAGRSVAIEYAPVRVKCPNKKCRSHACEMLAWADPYQRQTHRLQHHLALEAFSMPVMHVAAQYALSWATVQRAEIAAIQRWDATRPAVPLRFVGVDEKYLGRRNKLLDKFVTIVSNLETGEPLWIGYGREAATLTSWLSTLTPEQKKNIQLFSTDMWPAFRLAIRSDAELAHAVHTHDPFHVIKRAGEALTDLRRSVFFRAGGEMRQVGKGTRWLVLRAWEKCTEAQQAEIKRLLALNAKFAHAYQVVEELREVLHAPDRPAMVIGLSRILRRTERRANVPMRKLHDSLDSHFQQIVALGEYHPPTGRVEALNTNWEALVRRGRGYRDHQYLLLKLRFMTANPIRHKDGVKRFLALGLPTPMKAATLPPRATRVPRPRRRHPLPHRPHVPPTNARCERQESARSRPQPQGA
jgi:transposase